MGCFVGPSVLFCPTFLSPGSLLLTLTMEYLTCFPTLAYKLVHLQCTRIPRLLSLVLLHNSECHFHAIAEHNLSQS